MFLVQQLHHTFTERVQERNVKLSWRSTSSGRRRARSLRLDQNDGKVLAVNVCVESRAVVDLGHGLHDAHNQVLYEEVTVLLFLHAMLDPFHTLADSVFVEAEHVYLAFDDTAQQSGSQELGLHKNRRRTAIHEAIRSCVEDSLSVFRQSPETSR